jgi:UDP-glucose 4-epimerase
VIALTESVSTVVRIPYDDVYASGIDDIPRRVPDTRKLSSLIGWSPTHNLDAILRSIVDDIAAHPPSTVATPIARG